MSKLDAGAQFPYLKLNIGENDSINLPGDIETDYAIILFYRGHW